MSQKAIAEIIRNRRLDLLLSYEEMADVLGISSGALQSFEEGKSHPPPAFFTIWNLRYPEKEADGKEKATEDERLSTATTLLAAMLSNQSEGRIGYRQVETTLVPEAVTYADLLIRQLRRTAC